MELLLQGRQTGLVAQQDGEYFHFAAKLYRLTAWKAGTRWSPTVIGTRWSSTIIRTSWSPTIIGTKWSSSIIGTRWSCIVTATELYLSESVLSQ